jgi:alpha-amylase
MQKLIFLALLLSSSLSLSAQDFMLQGWYWDYDKDGCNGYSGTNWASRLNAQVADLAAAGITYAWLPPASRASFGACSNGYDPKDLYDLGEFGLGRTGFGTRAEVDALIANLNGAGIEAVADVVYNHRDGGAPEDNPAVKAYVENHFVTGKQPFPSDRYRLRLPLGGAYGAGDYFIKLSSKTQSYGANEYKFYATVASMNKPFQGSINESEPNGGGDCGQLNNDVLLDQDMIGKLFDFGGCYTDEFKLTIGAADFNAGGDDLLISMTNVSGGYSDHRIYDIFYAPADGSTGFNINMADLIFQTFTDFNGLPSGQGGMNFENFRPNSANTSTTFMAGDFDSPLFFYDVVQEEPSSLTTYADWSYWLLEDAGFGGLRLDAIKHFPASFVAEILDDLAGRGKNPGMVVGEFFDANPNLLKDWVDAVNAEVTSSSSLVRVFDFSLRDALKAACDNFGYDARSVFNASLYDNGLPGFNVATFVNNHDFRGPGEAVQNEAMLAYAYILTNNQLGVPTIFYPDFFGTTIPDAPVNDFGEEIAQLIDIHKNHLFGATTVDYLNRFSSPYPAAYQQGGASSSLVYQLGGGASGEEVIVAINFGGTTLKVEQTIDLPANLLGATPLTFTDLTGNAFNATATTDASNRLLIDVPARSYAVYVSGASLPVELLDLTATADAKGKVELRWETATEEALDRFTVTVSTDGVRFTTLAEQTPEHRPATYVVTDERPWTAPTRFYRLKTTSTNGSEQYSPVRSLRFALAEISIVPNPTVDIVTVNGLPPNAIWALTTTDGRQLSVPAQLEGGVALRLDLRTLPKGIYFLRVGADVYRLARQ